jgi:hypothetical protein
MAAERACSRRDHRRSNQSSLKKCHLPPDWVVERCSRSLKASRSEDLEIEPPVTCGEFATFHVHTTMPDMLSPVLIGYQVVQMYQTSQQRLLTPLGWLNPFIMNNFRSNALYA